MQNEYNRTKFKDALGRSLFIGQKVQYRGKISEEMPEKNGVIVKISGGIAFAIPCGNVLRVTKLRWTNHKKNCAEIAVLYVN